ncbi:amidohydrolase family protein [Aestuariimicrobium sp. p3-SID1156]|uniref:amidohydrolase family protein n=1 Tax=Aestuariimicrobium sp. p3-SID1156 TaxID=2916038 RepID=UPI00223B4B0D|nr:amidohydrolase family protein [Aestuariimicrobium sp. p3-SID1156]MCT1460290.1 amidohydrolase family protein [Aestuariimicrobium sp. p3-SID1156]
MGQSTNPFFHTHSHGGLTHTHVDGEQPHFHGALHLRGRVLPGGEEDDLWISEGVIRTEPVEDSVTIATDCWIVPGLVDAHCHIGLNHAGAVGAEEAEAQALTDRDAGTLLVRDAGSPADTHWIDDRADLPRIIRAGRHIARPKRYIRNFAAEVDPDDLVATVEEQVARGDGWVKLVGDWIDRDKGDLAPLWPAGVAKQAIDRAHELGARVTAHCFEEQSAAELVDAGIDGIEHGTGLDDATIETMAERQVALVPTLVNLENFPAIAASGEEKFPHYAEHMRALYAKRLEVFGKAKEAGVPIFAGTDAGGTMAHGLIGDEVELLTQVGDTGFALGAASWRAREWLGVPGIEEGASADLLVYDTDPLADVSAVKNPLFIILRGRIVKAR